MTTDLPSAEELKNEIEFCLTHGVSDLGEIIRADRRAVALACQGLLYKERIVEGDHEAWNNAIMHCTMVLHRFSERLGSPPDGEQRNRLRKGEM